MKKKAATRRRPHSISFEGVRSLTQQKFKDECNVNYIVDQFARTGRLPRFLGEPRYGYAPALDFREALELVMSQEEFFNELPSGVRQRFNNDPLELLSFVENPDNLEEARQLGLAKGETKQEKPVEPEGEAAAPSPSPAPSEAAPSSSSSG